MSDPFETLGVKPGASVLEAERAYRSLKELYSEDSLATYSLLDPEQRRKLLDSLDLAFSRIAASIGQRHKAAAAIPQARVEPEIVEPKIEDAPMPDPEQHPGAYLRWLRQRAGISLKYISERTKLSLARLEDIELERLDRLPVPVYLQGYIAEYARCLKIDEPRRLIDNYLKQLPRK